MLDNTLALHEVLSTDGPRPRELVDLERLLFSPDEPRELAAEYGAT